MALREPQTVLVGKAPGVEGLLLRGGVVGQGILRRRHYVQLAGETLSDAAVQHHRGLGAADYAEAQRAVLPGPDEEVAAAGVKRSEAVGIGLVSGYRVEFSVVVYLELDALYAAV